MALFVDGLCCPICGKPMYEDSDEIFGLTMWGIKDERFKILDDSCMHQACIDHWELRNEFLDYYNTNCCDELRINDEGRVYYERESDRLLGVITFIPVVLILPMLILSELFGDNFIGKIVALILTIALAIVSASLATAKVGLLWAFPVVFLTFLIADALLLLSLYFYLSYQKELNQS
jgi:hypothetical protein